jgi:hypothetical protein
MGSIFFNFYTNLCWCAVFVTGLLTFEMGHQEEEVKKKLSKISKMFLSWLKLLAA